MKKIMLTLVVLAICVFSISAQTVDEIIGKYHQSIGGLELLKSHTSTKAFGKAPTPQGDFPFELFQEKPNKIKVSLDIMGKKMIPQAFDGQTAWMLNPFMGDTAQKLPEDQVKSLLDDAELEDPFIDYAAKGHEVTLEGTEDVQGNPCFKIKLVKYKGNESRESTQYYYFDQGSFIPLMIKNSVNVGGQADQVIETYLSDYQEVGNGMVMPFSFEVKMAGQIVQSIIFEKIIINEDIPDEEFKFPGQAQ